MFKDKPKSVRFAKTFVSDDEVKTVPNLAYDLSDLDELRRMGKPISQESVSSLYYDGEVQDRCYVPLERQRGVDINDVWNAQQTGRRKASKAGVRQVDLSNIKTN